MKIISVDNFNNEAVADYLVAENIENIEHATTMCKALNDKFSEEMALRFYRVVEDDYRLSKGIEDLV